MMGKAEMMSSTDEETTKRHFLSIPQTDMEPLGNGITLLENQVGGHNFNGKTIGTHFPSE